MDRLFSLISVILPSALLIVTIYRFIGLRRATPVDSVIVGHEDTETYDPDTGSGTARAFLCRYTWNGVTTTYRSRYAGWFRKEGDIVRLYVTDAGTIIEKGDVILPLIVAAVLFIAMPFAGQ